MLTKQKAMIENNEKLMLKNAALKKLVRELRKELREARGEDKKKAAKKKKERK